MATLAETARGIGPISVGNPVESQGKYPLPEGLPVMPEVLSAKVWQRVDVGTLTGGDPQFLSDVHAQGYGTHTVEAMGKPLHTIISQDRPVVLGPYRVDASIRQSLIENGYRLAHVEITDATKIRFGGQWGESQGVIRVEHGYGPLFISSAERPFPYAIASAYQASVRGIEDETKKKMLEEMMRHGKLDPELLADAARLVMGKMIDVRHERVPVAVLTRTKDRAWLRYFADAGVVVNDYREKVPFKSTDQREKEVVHWRKLFSSV